MYGFSRKAIENLRGPWSVFPQKRARPERGSDALNCQYTETGPQTRDGFSATFLAVTGIVRTMYNWVTNSEGFGPLNRLLYYEGDTLWMRDLINSVVVQLYTLAGMGVSVAEADDKLYTAVVGPDGRGAGEARIIFPLISGSPSDKAFGGPSSSVPVVADNGAGFCTVGTKKFAYIKESRSGFRGKPSPEITFTVDRGGRKLKMTVTGDTPSDTAWFHPIMTTTANQDRWFFVPDAAVGVPPGAPGWSALMDIDISDDTLTRVGLEATDYFDKLTQSSAGTGPFSPSFIMQVWRRVAWFVSPKIYVSDIDNFESVTEADHVIYLPGRREVVTGFMQRGVWYVLGPAWTHAYVDNSGTPNEWQPPATVSNAIGTPSPFGVSSRTAGDWAWVASPSGLYVFTGQYSEMPISYLNEDWWERINWADPTKIEVKDDVLKRIVMVKAPLDGATEPNWLLTWDYARVAGPPTPYEVDFAPYKFGFGPLYAVEPFIDPVTAKLTTLLAKSGALIRQEESGPSDAGYGIESFYRTSHVLTSADIHAVPCRFGAVDLGVSGAGLCEIEVRNKGLTQVKQPSPIMLQSAPPYEDHRKVSLTGNNFDIKVRVSGVGARFDLQHGTTLLGTVDLQCVTR